MMPWEIWCRRFFRTVGLVSLTVAAFAISAGGTSPAERAQVYFVAVGSSWYAAPAGPGERGLGKLPGGNKSARVIAGLLNRGGARFGVVLTSGDGQFISLADIRSAIDRTVKAMREDRPAAPLLVFYFAGHGISDGVAWNHFSLPGTFVYRGDASQLHVDQLAGKTLHAASLADDLDKLKVPYLVLLDTCYEGKEARFDSPVLTGAAVESLRATAGVLRFVNEFHQESPVIFSTEPGTVVSTAPDSTDPKADPIGPLARRATIVFDESRRTGHDLSLGAFVKRMVADDLDRLTKPAMTKAQSGRTWERLLASTGPDHGTVETASGTATSPEFCCGESVEGASRDDKSSTAQPRQMSGSVRLAGSAGEYITEGKAIKVISPGVPITLTENGPGDITIEAGDGADAWEVSLSTHDGRPFAKRRYDGAQRHSFADPGHAGLSVSGDGRACNAVNGDFVVKEVVYGTGGELTRLVATVTQRCEDNKAPLVGEIELRAPVKR